MCNCQNIPVPQMHIPKARSINRVNAFLDPANKTGKYNLLVGLRGDKEVTKVSYAAFEFIKMISYFAGLVDPVSGNTVSGVRIYPVAYFPEGSPHVPAGSGNMLTLIFAPTVSVGANFPDIKSYFIIAPDGVFDPSLAMNDAASNSLDFTTANNWALNYQDVVKGELSVLNTTVAGADGDTRSIYYPLSKLAELAVEIICQNANGIHAKFTTQLADDPYPGMLDVEFILTKNVNGTDADDFYSEDDPCFANRPKRMALRDDTGSPCPPNCGHGSSIGH